MLFLIEEINVKHNINIENRKKAVISGVKEVVEFSSDAIDTVTAMGNLSIRGNDLKICGFNATVGELEISGLIVALVYTTDTKKSSLISRIFK